MTIRHFEVEDAVTSTIFENYKFVRGEIIVQARLGALYREIEAMVGAHGGEIVGFLEVPNVYQVYFHGLTEVELRNLVDMFNNNDDVIIANLNLVIRGH